MNSLSLILAPRAQQLRCSKSGTGDLFPFHNVTINQATIAEESLCEAAHSKRAASTLIVKHRDNQFINLVRSTLERVESSEAAKDKESAVQELRRSVVRVIAERELRNSDIKPIPTSTNEPAA